jgi:hypothetical protein
MTTSASNGVAGGSIAVGPPALAGRQPLPLAFILFLLIGCQRYWLPAPLTPSEHSLLGCYVLQSGPWPDSKSSPGTLRVQFDTLRWRDGAQRRLLILDSTKHRQPLAYWAPLPPDSLLVRIGEGVEGQGLEIRLQVTGDSLHGIATNHLWVDISRSALALGARSPCPTP